MSQPLRLAVLTCGGHTAFFCILYFVFLFIYLFLSIHFYCLSVKKIKIKMSQPLIQMVSCYQDSTHMWHYIMKETGYGIISVPDLLDSVKLSN